MRKIKRHIAFALCVAALLFCACVKHKDGLEFKNDVNELSFDISSLSSKSSAILDVDSIVSMGIFAYSTGSRDFEYTNPSRTPNLINNQAASRPVGGEWSYSPVAYWPTDPSVKNTFFAYSPHSSQFSEAANVLVSTSNTLGVPTLRYTIPSNIPEQYDILCAAPVFDKTRHSADDQVRDGKVTYKMNHSLSWLAFVVVPSLYHSEDERYTVNSFAFVADDIPTTATLDMSTGEWTNPRYTMAEYEFQLNDAAIDMVPGKAARIIKEDNRLMLFPFSIDGETTKATVNLSFTYEYNDPGNPNPVSSDPEEYFYFMPFPSTVLRPGRVTVYVINISVDGISVEFLKDNLIEDWIEEMGEKEIEIF